jgi:hypothetical protein
VSNRTPKAVSSRYHVLSRDPKQIPDIPAQWTEEDDALLIRMRDVDCLDWEEIRQACTYMLESIELTIPVPSRTLNALKTRYSILLCSTPQEIARRRVPLEIKPWTDYEDQALFRLKKKNVKFSEIKKFCKQPFILKFANNQSMGAVLKRSEPATWRSGLIETLILQPRLNLSGHRQVMWMLPGIQWT